MAGLAATTAAAVAFAVLAAVSPASAHPRAEDRDAAQAGTKAFHRVSVAKEAGYGLLTDKDGIACIDDPAGGMGIHYANINLVGDPEVSASTPEVLVYEPQADGRLRLVAVEYVTLKQAWEDAGHTSPPMLFGTEFELVKDPNRYGLPDFYELHAWIWRYNPNGFNDDWNPRVTCEHAA
jgi:hypothetical protein